MYCLPKVIANQCARTKELSEKRRSTWLARINRKDLKTLNNVRVCGRHFKTGRPAKLFDETNPDWAPNILLGHGCMEQTPTKFARYERRKMRAAKSAAVGDSCEVVSPSTCDTMDLDAADTEVPSSTVPSSPVSTASPGCSFTAANTAFADTATQTDVTAADLKALEEDNQRLTSELRTLRIQKSALEITELSLREDPEKVSFYTGLPSFAVLFSIYQLLEVSVKHTPQRCLGKFQEFVVFLMKLKWNFPLQDLGYRFRVSESTISRVFDRWLHTAFWRLKETIVWPSRDEICNTMPQAFYDSFGRKVALIIDCFEIKIERPSSLQPRCKTWSQYKSSNTAKYLIGICPQGIITFISKGWGGRTSDKHITENCGVLDKLSHGDVVLADRGFDIADSLGLYCAKLHIPAFTKGKRQLSAMEVETTRKIANVRIHVERVIGLVRNKYVIMKAVQPVHFVTRKEGDNIALLDKVVTVCCALTNFCSSVVPVNDE